MDAIEHEAASVAATVAATDAAPVPRIEIVGERRRAHDAAFRERVVAESLVPGTRVQDVARRHGICASLIYRWRRCGSAPRVSAPAVKLVPVRVSGPVAMSGSASSREAKPSSIIEIEFAGDVRVRVDADVSLAALRRVVTALRG